MSLLRAPQMEPMADTYIIYTPKLEIEIVIFDREGRILSPVLSGAQQDVFTT